MNQKFGSRQGGSFPLILSLALVAIVSLLSIFARSLDAAIVPTGNVSPALPWSSSTTGYIGKTSDGSLLVDAGSQLASLYTYIAYNSGVTGTVTVTGADSKWTNSRGLYVGYFGNGSFTVTDGGTVTATTLFASLENIHGNGTITATGGAVLDADLRFDAAHGTQGTFAFGSGGTLIVNANGGEVGAGYKENGSLTVAEGVAIASSYGYLGYHSGSTGTATITGAGSKWTNSIYLYVGLYGSGELNIEAGGEVSNSAAYLGYNSGSTGTATITGVGSRWNTYGGTLFVGNSGNGILNLRSGGQSSYATSYLGYETGSTGTANVTGTGSKWTINDTLYLGYLGSGTLNIEAGGQVTSPIATLGYGSITNSDAVGIVNVIGPESKWVNAGGIIVGFWGKGTLNIQAGGQVSNTNSYDSIMLGFYSSSLGTVTVNGAGSQWTNKCSLYIGDLGRGELRIEAGGQVSNSKGTLGFHAGSNGSVLVTGLNSKWTNSGDLFIGNAGNGTLNVEAGGQVSNAIGYLGYKSHAMGAVTVTGAGSKWTNSSSLYIGYEENGVLKIEAGGQVSNTRGEVGCGLSTSSGTVTVTGAGSQWTNSGELCIGRLGDAELRIEAGGQVNNTIGYVANWPSSTSTVTVTDVGSKWTNNGILYVGYSGDGTLNLLAGGQVSNKDAFLGYNAGSKGTARATGIDSIWTINGGLYIGNSGTGTLNIEAGAQVSNVTGYLGYNVGSTGTANVAGAGAAWVNNYLYVGHNGNGTLTVSDGGTVTVNQGLFASLNSLLGNGIIATKGAVLDADFVFDAMHGLQKDFAFGTGGTLQISQDENGVLGAGYKSLGTLRIAEGIAVPSSNGCLGYRSGSTGIATVTGAGSKWINNGTLEVGLSGIATLLVEEGGKVYSTFGFVGRNAGSTGTVTVTGANSEWNDSGGINVGLSGSGTLIIENGGRVLSSGGTIGHSASSSVGAVTVAGANSEWNNSGGLNVGFSGNGTLIIENGGRVSNTFGYIGNSTGSVATVLVRNDGSRWANSSDLNIGRSGRGELTIEAGGQVSNTNGYIGNNAGSVGTVMVDGAGSMWTNSTSLSVGRFGKGTLNIGSATNNGGLVTAPTLTIAYGSSSEAVCSLNEGSILRVGTMVKGSGLANFTWNDGTIQNYDPTTDLTINSAQNLILKLSATGTHAFKIDAGRTGTINAVLSDATSGGTLAKQGEGLLTLTGANTYSGQTTVEAGRFKVTGSILATSGIDVTAGATFELAKTPASATAASLVITNQGTFLISAGAQTVGTISGIGITQVNPGATLTARSIVQDSLFIGTTGAGAASLGENSSIHQVPEPSVITLLLAAAVAMLVPVCCWKR